MIGRSQPEPRSGEGCDQADHGRPVEAMKVFLATVSQTNGRGPRCTEADQAGIEAPVLSLQLDDPLEEEDEVWDTAMVEAVSTVMNTVEVSNQALVGGPGQKQGSSLGQGATFKNCTFHFTCQSNSGSGRFFLTSSFSFFFFCVPLIAVVLIIRSATCS